MNYLLKLAVSIALLALIVRHVPLSDLPSTLARTRPGWLFAAILFQLGSNIVASYRWSLIMQRLGFLKPYSFFLASFFKGAFFNQGLPTSIGGDGLRIYDCIRLGKGKELAVSGVFIDRIVGLAGLVLLNLFALSATRGLLPDSLHLPLLLLLLLLLGGLLLLFFLKDIGFMNRLRPLAFFRRLSVHFRVVYANLRDFFRQTSLSVLTHLLSMCAFYCLGTAVGLAYPLPVYLALVPPVILLTILPVSLAGWGIREGAMVGIFLLIGADQTRILALSILYGLLTIVTASPGLLLFLHSRHIRQQP